MPYKNLSRKKMKSTSGKKLTARQKELGAMTPAKMKAAAIAAAKASGSSKPVKSGAKKKPRAAISAPMGPKRSAEAIAALKMQAAAKKKAAPKKKPVKKAK